MLLGPNTMVQSPYASSSPAMLPPLPISTAPSKPEKFRGEPTAESCTLPFSNPSTSLCPAWKETYLGWSRLESVCVTTLPHQASSSAILTYAARLLDRKSTRLNSSHVAISYAVFCFKHK